MQFSESFPHLPFPVLITGSYDRTARIWNLETGEEIRCIKGHTRAVRTLQFDEVKLVTGSMDHTLRIWNWRTGECISTLEGHTEGVICLNFDSTLLASGSIDTTIKVWILRTRECFTLRGHRDRVNSVLLWDSSSTSSVPDASSQQNVSPGKMLFSASDDCSVRMWDLTLRTCVLQFSGHIGQVQSLKLLPLDLCNAKEDASKDRRCDENSTLPTAGGAQSPREVTQPQQLLVSGSLDNTVKLWDIDSGKVVRTHFGHLEGVWAVACNKMRLVSGSHDRTIKVRKSLGKAVWTY
jgi:F-box/WD-40 domain protein MET30